MHERLDEHSRSHEAFGMQWPRELDRLWPVAQLGEVSSEAIQIVRLVPQVELAPHEEREVLDALR